jgi:peptidoglycan L-alanyl-D-glutamate endopeptidase CwlK
MISHKEISVSRINSLDPRLISSAMKVYNRCMQERIFLYIIWGKRSTEEQNTLYRIGRDISGQILTVRKGGHSAHNYGMALDFCLLQDSYMMTWEDCCNRSYWKKKWWRAVDYFEEEGWESGWRWSSFEPGHVENLLGKSIGELIKEKGEHEQDQTRNIWNSNFRGQDPNQEFYL